MIVRTEGQYMICDCGARNTDWRYPQSVCYMCKEPLVSPAHAKALKQSQALRSIPVVKPKPQSVERMANAMAAIHFGLKFGRSLHNLLRDDRPICRPRTGSRIANGSWCTEDQLGVDLDWRNESYGRPRVGFTKIDPAPRIGKKRQQLSQGGIIPSYVGTYGYDYVMIEHHPDGSETINTSKPRDLAPRIGKRRQQEPHDFDCHPYHPCDKCKGQR